MRKIDNVHDKIHLELTTIGIQAIDLVAHYKTFYNLIQSYTIRPKNLMSDEANMDCEIMSWGYTLPSVANLHLMPSSTNCTYYEQPLPCLLYTSPSPRD